MSRVLADSLGFLRNPGELPFVSANDSLPDLDLVHLTAAPPWLGSVGEVITAVKQFRENLALHPNVVIVEKRSDLERTGVLKVVLGLQNAPEYCLSRTTMGLLQEFGVRIVQIAYKDQNEYGGGFAWPAMGLTDHGRILIRVMGQCGMILDLSHAGHQTARDALKFIREEGVRVSVCITHTGCYSVYPHIRNLPDDVLKGVAELGGVVGIYGLTFGLDRTENDWLAVFRHICQAERLAGKEAVCIGSDIPYNAVSAKKDFERFEMMRAKFDADGLLNARYPDYVTDLLGPNKMAWLSKELLTEESDDLNGKNICGRNFLNFLQRSLPE